jgi:hypothetical protein
MKVKGRRVITRGKEREGERLGGVLCLLSGYLTRSCTCLRTLSNSLTCSQTDRQTHSQKKEKKQQRHDPSRSPSHSFVFLTPNSHSHSYSQTPSLYNKHPHKYHTPTAIFEPTSRSSPKYSGLLPYEEGKRSTSQR